MRRGATFVVLLVLAAVCGAGQSHASARSVPFAWHSDGRTTMPLQSSVVRLVRTAEQAKQLHHQIAQYDVRGGFRDYAVLAVYFAGDRPAVHVTRLLSSGSTLAVSLAVAPAQAEAPSSGAYNLVLVPKRLVSSVRAVRVASVEEKPLSQVPELGGPPFGDPTVAIAGTPRPRAGKFFTAIVATLAHPSSYLVSEIGCRGTVGGHWMPVPGSVYRQLVGGKPLHGVIRRTYTRGGFLRRFTCGWRIPASAAGKLVALEENNCISPCESGLMYTVHFLGADRWQGAYPNAWRSVGWRVRR